MHDPWAAISVMHGEEGVAVIVSIIVVVIVMDSVVLIVILGVIVALVAGTAERCLVLSRSSLMV